MSETDSPWLRFLVELAAEIGPEDRLVELSFVDDKLMHSLNREYRGRDGPTDVLSFHYGADAEGLAAPEEDPEGEILISIDSARRQAGEKGHTIAEELSVLAIHGLHHILGYNHESEEEATEMEAAEAPYRLRLRRYLNSLERS